MIASVVVALLGSAASAPQPAIGRVLVLETTAPTIAAADRERVESRMEAVLEAGDIRTASRAARLDARACQTQVCLQRTADEHGITHWLRAEIEGDDREYRVRVAAGRIGETAAVAESSGECMICGIDDLAASLEARTVAIRAQLVGTREGSEPRNPNQAAWRRLGPVEPRSDRGGNVLRPTGIALLALGSAGVVGGAVLLGIDGEEIRRRCNAAPQNLDADGDCRFVHDTRAGGITLLTGGVLAAAGGITLVTIDRKRRRAHLRARLGYNRIVLEGRF